jgi:hypothetical protein
LLHIRVLYHEGAYHEHVCSRAGTPQTPKRLKGMTAEAIARMEREPSRLQEAISSIQDSYGQDHLHLTVVKGYLRKLVTNERVAR